MQKKYEERRAQITKKRLAEGKGFLGPDKLKEIVAGSKPHSTKKSERYDYRPRVLSVCTERRSIALEFYFDNFHKFKKASHKFREGNLLVEFPLGMYKPSSRPPPHQTSTTLQ